MSGLRIKASSKTCKMIDGVPTEEKLNKFKHGVWCNKRKREVILQNMSDLNGVITNSNEIISDYKLKLEKLR